MKYRSFFAGLVLLSLCGVVFSQTALPYFDYDATLLQPGKFLQYRSSDQDGGDVSFESFFVSDSNTIETFGSLYKDFTRLAEVASSSRYEFDWNTMMITNYSHTNHRTSGYQPGTARLISFRTRPELNRVTMEYEYATDNYEFKKDTKNIQYRSTPSFFGNTWAMEIVIVSRFLRLAPRQRTSFGTFSTAGYTEFDIWQERTEIVLGIECTKFEFRASGLLGAIFGPRGRLWVSTESGDVVRYEMDLALNNQKNLRMDLLETRQISNDEWKRMMSVVR